MKSTKEVAFHGRIKRGRLELAEGEADRLGEPLPDTWLVAHPQGRRKVASWRRSSSFLVLRWDE
jgi:hypothetical protein